MTMKIPIATKWPAPRSYSRSSGRPMSSTVTTEPVTPSSTPRARLIDLSRHSTAGTRCSYSSTSISPRQPRRARLEGVHHVLLHRREGQAPGQRQGAERLDADRHSQRLLRSPLPPPARPPPLHHLLQRGGGRARSRRG